MAVAYFILVGASAQAVLGLAFMLNVRGVGVRYVYWQRRKRAARRGVSRVRFPSPRGTRFVAAVTGLAWVLLDGTIAIFLLGGVLQ
jgi:hypothetical protein